MKNVSRDKLRFSVNGMKGNQGNIDALNDVIEYVEGLESDNDNQRKLLDLQDIEMKAIKRSLEMESIRLHVWPPF